jgi:hypothetical protein
MKKIFVALFVLLSVSAFAQNISLSKIGITYSFDQQLLPDQVNIHEFYGYSAIERGDNNFTAGITTEIKLLSRLSLRTGLLYSNKDYTGYFGCPQCYYDVMPGYSWDYPRETIKQRYLEIPATARFYFVQNRLNVFGDIGVVNSFLVDNQSTNGNIEGSEVKSNNFIFQAEAGVGVSFTIVRYIEISITTVYRNSITTYIATDDMQLRAFGVVGGISYRFKNVRPE